MIEKPTSKAPENEVVEDVVTKENSTERQLSEEELKRLFFLSFRFSQGHAPLQGELFKCFRQYYGRQSILRGLKEILDSYILSLFKDDSLLSHRYVASVDRTSIVEAGNFRNTLGSKKISVVNKREILKLTLERDAKFSGGRTRKDTDEKVHFSFFIDYILRQKKTGEKSLDQLFSKIREQLKEESLQGILRKDNYASVKDIINKYNDHSPQTKVTEEELSALGIDLKL